MILTVCFTLQARCITLPGAIGRRLREVRPLESGAHEMLRFDHLREANACVCGDPDEVIERRKAYEATGADLLLCLMNPYKTPHEKVMQTIERMGRHVLPAFS